MNSLGIKRFKQLRAIFKSLEGGASVLQSCRAANIDPATLWHWRKKNERLDRKIYNIVESRIQIAEDQLFKKVLEGHAVSMFFFLCNRAPDRWHNIADIKNIIYNMNNSKEGKEGGQDRFKDTPRFVFQDVKEPTTNE